MPREFASLGVNFPLKVYFGSVLSSRKGNMKWQNCFLLQKLQQTWKCTHMPEVP